MTPIVGIEVRLNSRGKKRSFLLNNLSFFTHFAANTGIITPLMQ